MYRPFGRGRITSSSECPPTANGLQTNGTTQGRSQEHAAEGHFAKALLSGTDQVQTTPLIMVLTGL